MKPPLLSPPVNYDSLLYHAPAENATAPPHSPPQTLSFPGGCCIIRRSLYLSIIGRGGFRPVCLRMECV